MIASSNFTENGFSYDLNGNIRKLTRTSASGSPMDLLRYDYVGQGTGGNQLRSVTDAGDISKGFVDGNISGDDYVYDVNGNMTADKNKNIATITYNYLNLPQQVTKGTGEKIIYTYDAGGRKLKQQVYNASSTVTKTTEYDGEFIYQGDTLQFINHEEGRIVMKGVASPEYQYHLKDHLGNVRVTFTAVPPVDANIATYEDVNINVEQNKFLRYSNARRINATIFDHTNGSATGDSERLNGSANEIYGLARSISVMPGDVISAEVYAKYVDTNTSNWTAALNTLMGQIAANTAGVVVDGATYSSSTSSFPAAYGSLQSKSDNGAPKAYLNWLVFDRNFVFITGGFKQITTTGKEAGSDVPHEYVASPNIQITQPGYVYIYLSNENPTPVEVYFDDFKVTQNYFPVVQQEDFYPFGLSFNSYSRENIVPQNYLYQKKEWQQDLNVNLFDFGARQYDPAIGRTTTLDPHGDKYASLSPYSWAADNPLKIIDPSGKDIILIYKDDKGKERNYDYKNGSTYKGNNAFIKGFYAAVKLLNDKGVGDKIKALENHQQQFAIRETAKGDPKNPAGESNHPAGSKGMTWNPNMGLKTDKGVILSPTTVLNHEADHGLNDLNHQAKHMADSQYGTDTQYETKEERRVIAGSEQGTATALGEIKPGQVTRENHKGENFETTGPTTTDPKGNN